MSVQVCRNADSIAISRSVIPILPLQEDWITVSPQATNCFDGEVSTRRGFAPAAIPARSRCCRY